MALTKITKTGITNSAVDNNKIEADAVDATKIADNAISEEHLDATVITGHTELDEAAQSTDVLLVYDTSAGVIKKILASNVGAQAPTVSSVSPTSVTSGDGTGNYTFTITGTGFTGGSADLINASGTNINFDTVTVDSATQITGVIAKSSLPGSGEPYDVRVTAANGLKNTLENQINIDQQPVFNTATGSLGTFADNARTGISLTIDADDPESAGNVTYELQSGTLPAGLSLSNSGVDGGVGIISGTATAVSSDTTYNFVIRAVDAASNTSSRAYSITIEAPPIEIFNTSGSFSVPVGVTTLDAVLVVAGGGGGGRATPGNTAGGGGGAGGLIYFPCYPVSPGGTITVTVGCGGATTADGTSPGQPSLGTTGQNSVFGSPSDPGFSPTSSVLTAQGGGGGGNENSGGAPGGSGGGSGQTNPAGAGDQPGAPGNSGAYGFGNAGATGTGPTAGTDNGGGGGAGAAGTSGPTSGRGGSGGIGKAYSISGQSIYYAGGGGGGGCASPDTGGLAGQGGGGDGGDLESVGAPGSRTGGGNVGTANRGGGGGGGGRAGSPCGGPGGGGGKGVVIVAWTE